VAPGLVAIAGGKYTTYRVMAADAVDAASADLPGRVAPSITDKVPLLGADGYHALVNQADQLAARYGLHPYRVRHLLDRYGSAVYQVLDLAADDPELLRPVPAAPDYLKVEAVYAASHEGALHVEDVLTRRTRISIEYPHRGLDSAEPVARLVGEVLGWDEDTIAREIAVYRARVDAERDSQSQPDDQAADAKRAAAPEVRPAILENVS
jgi:glycerol-3-phosphate dehydrogenase